MKTLRVTFLASMVLMLSGLSNVGRANAELQPVTSVDVGRYMGTWYEIAKYPNSFQKGCDNVTATYTLRPDGKHFDVLNRCLEPDGSERTAKGRGWMPDHNEPGKLRVSFFLFFSAKYWIIDLGDDYEYAVVGEPDREYLWILSRKPKIDEATYQGILQRLVTHGYDPAKLEQTAQSGAGS